ncbi:HNH endonuclease [Tropicimonas sp. IMCC6043]|nr:HNH endonuclease [Tropicimonas sp. IMCC6043]
MTLRAERAPGSIALALADTGIALRVDPVILHTIAAEGIGNLNDGLLLLPDFSAATVACTRAWHLARSLPTAPGDALTEALSREGLTWSGPAGQDLDPTRATTREAKVRLRVGQDTFRATLMDYWEARCPLTGITDPGLLRASHIVPWSVCESDAQRLDVFNGFLLSALWDAAFDGFLVTFDETGRAVAAPALSKEAALGLNLASAPTVNLTDQHQVPLAYHRARTLDSSS